MSTNNRIFYACQSVQIGDSGGGSFETIEGLQSVGMNTNFNLEPIYQLGRLELYDNFEEIPDVEITLNKVLDGTSTIYAMAMGDGKLVDLADVKCSVRLSLYSDRSEAATGTAIASVTCKPAYLSSVTYTFPVEGNSTEEVTIVSNDKVWGSAGSTAPPSGDPNNPPDIVRRAQVSISGSTLPTVGKGAIPSGAKISNITVSMNLGREEIRELGKASPYTRYINFPVEITTEIEVTATNGDLITASGDKPPCSNARDLDNQEIIIALCDGMTLNLGERNKLTSVNYTGGDTGGGNATITYSYQTYNDFTFTS